MGESSMLKGLAHQLIVKGVLSYTYIYMYLGTYVQCHSHRKLQMARLIIYMVRAQFRILFVP